MRQGLLLLVAGCADAYHLHAAGRAIHAGAGARAPHAALQAPKTLRAPPTPPTVSDGDGDDDGDGLWLRTLDKPHINTVLGLWLWQHEEASTQECGADESQQLSAEMRTMLAWDGEPEESHASWLTSSALKPRYFGAYIDEEIVACVQLRYQRDTMSGLRPFIEGRHVTMVDHVLVIPSMPPHLRKLVSAGVIDALRDMARCHRMHVIFT